MKNLRSYAVLEGFVFVFVYIMVIYRQFGLKYWKMLGIDNNWSHFIWCTYQFDMVWSGFDIMGFVG